MGKIKQKKLTFHAKAPKASNDEYKLPELQESCKNLPELKFEVWKLWIFFVLY